MEWDISLDSGPMLVATATTENGLVFSVEANLYGGYSIREITEKGLPSAAENWEIYGKVLEHYYSRDDVVKLEEDDESGDNGN